MSLLKAFLCFNLTVGALGLYWNWTETGSTFNRDVSTLYGLKIPQFLKNVSVCNDSCHLVQRQSLVQFYSNTNGPKWLKGKHWNSTVFYCEWEGILCYNRTLHIIAINLQGNNGMKGYVNDTLGRIPYLLGIDMGGSELRGEVGALLRTFKDFFLRFDFANNQIHGYFPHDIVTNWKKMGKIQLSGNKNVKGRIPDNINLLEDLQVLSLGETGVTGSIPKSIGNLSNLYFLDLETLSMTGNLVQLKGLSKLKFIHLMGNRLQGEIPEDFGNWFPELFELILQENELQGNIPASIGQMTSLSLLQLSGNKQLVGKIPCSFRNLSNLEILDVSETQIQGFEEGFVLQSSKLSSFIAKRNKKFSISIYTLVAALGKSSHSLIQLDVQDCDIYGKFDKINDDTNLVNGIFRFSKLAFLNLGGNKRLNGSIPDPIGSLGLIMFFNASHTNMSSALPLSYLIKLKVLQEIDIRQNPYMRGVIEEPFMFIDDTLMGTEKANDNFKCPTMRLRHNNCIVKMDSMYYDKRHCLCNPGFYGQGGFCRQCMSGGICNGTKSKMKAVHNGTSMLGSEAFVATKMRLKRGYWPFPSSKNVTKLIKCHWTLPGKEVCNPHGQVYCYVRKIANRMITYCEEKGTCAKGAHGRLCSQCNKNYYKNGLQCLECPGKKDRTRVNVTIILAVIMIILIGVSCFAYAQNQKKFAAVCAILEAITIFVLAILGIMPSWLAEVNIFIFLLTIGGFGDFGKGVLKIAIFYVQIVDALITSNHIWPASIYNFVDLIGSLINLRFSVLGCQLPKIFTPIGKLLLLMILPVSITFLLATVFCLFYVTAQNKWPGTYNKIKYKCAHLSILFMNLSYFPLVKATFSILKPCHRVGDAEFMANYAWIDCRSKDHRNIHALAIFSVLLYVIGIPFVFLTLLIWKRDQVRQGDSSTQQWLGSLYKPYKTEYRITMEFLLMMRRTVLAFLISFFSEDIPIQTTLISIVFVISVALESHAKPFLDSTDNGHNQGNMFSRFGLENVIEVIMLVTLLISFIGVQTSTQATEKNITQLVWGIISINGIFIVILIVCFLVRLLKRRPDYNPLLEGDHAVIPHPTPPPTPRPTTPPAPPSTPPLTSSPSLERSTLSSTPTSQE